MFTAQVIFEKHVSYSVPAHLGTNLDLEPAVDW